MKTIEELAEGYIKRNDCTYDFVIWEWDTNHVVAFAQEIAKAQRERDMIEIEFWKQRVRLGLPLSSDKSVCMEGLEVRLAKLLEGK